MVPGNFSMTAVAFSKLEKRPPTPTPGHPEEKVLEMADLEKTMVASDRNVQETAEMKNNVEEYILQMRTKVTEGGVYSEYISNADRKTFLDACNSVESVLLEVEVLRGSWKRKEVVQPPHPRIIINSQFIGMIPLLLTHARR